MLLNSWYDVFGCYNMNWFDEWGLGGVEDEVNMLKTEIFGKLTDVNRLTSCVNRLNA